MANVEAEGAVTDTDKIIKKQSKRLGRESLANRKQSGRRHGTKKTNIN
jgi:hypothetical protein